MDDDSVVLFVGHEQETVTGFDSKYRSDGRRDEYVVAAVKMESAGCTAPNDGRVGVDVDGKCVAVVSTWGGDQLPAADAAGVVDRGDGRRQEYWCVCLGQKWW